MHKFLSKNTLLKLRTFECLVPKAYDLVETDQQLGRKINPIANKEGNNNLKLVLFS